MKPPANRVESFLRTPDPAIAAVLLFGPDAGLVRERGDRLIRAVAGTPDDPFRVVTLSSAEIAKDPARLADEAAALSLTGGRRAVRVRDAADALAAGLQRVLGGRSGDSLIVLEAGDLPARSSLRKLCEAAPDAAAIGCYPADAEALGRLAREMLSEAGKSIDPEAERLLGDRLAGDRQLARREIEKLIAYAGADRKIDADAVAACIGDSAEQSLDDLVLAAASGEAEQADRILARLFGEATSPVAVLRAAQRHFSRLHLAGLAVAGGATAEQAMARLKPPVFYKAQPRFRSQLSRWSPERSGAVIGQLIEAEADCKRTGLPDEAICGRILMQIARRARGPR